MAMPLDERRELPIAEAKALGAMALFGEKYGDKVRVVKFGDSIELCGGTHVSNTGRIGMVRILGESSIAAGIRRIEAVSGEAVEKVLDSLQDTLRDLASFLGNASDVKVAVQKAMKENAELRQQVDQFFEERIKNLTREILAEAKEINGIKVCRQVGIALPDVVKNVAFGIRKASPERTVFLAATVNAEKPLLTVMISDDLVKEQGLNASQIVREAAKLIKGGGGGQPFFAQAGGKDASGLSSAMQKMLESI